MGLPKQIDPANRAVGRPKGSLNKQTGEVLQKLKDRGIEPIEELVKLLPQLEPDMRANVLVRLLPYCYTQFKAVEVQKTVDHKVTVTTANVADLCKLARQSSPEASAPPDAQTAILEAELAAPDERAPRE